MKKIFFIYFCTTTVLYPMQLQKYTSIDKDQKWLQSCKKNVLILSGLTAISFSVYYGYKMIDPILPLDTYGDIISHSYSLGCLSGLLALSNICYSNILLNRLELIKKEIKKNNQYIQASWQFMHDLHD